MSSSATGLCWRRQTLRQLLAAQAALDTWVAEYNCDRPHQSLNMDYPAERFAPSQHTRAAAEELLPLRLPASLGAVPTPAPNADGPALGSAPPAPK